MAEKYIGAEAFKLSEYNKFMADGMTSLPDTNLQMFLASVYAKIARDVDEMPAADVEEVVRCKDCTYCKPDPLSKGALMCTHEQWYIEFPPNVDPDFFCKGGERKKGTTYEERGNET